MTILINKEKIYLALQLIKIMNQNIFKLFTKYISLNQIFNKKGGRKSVIDKPELEEQYISLLNLEDEILRKMGLPKKLIYRSIIFNLTKEKNINPVWIELKKSAEDYLLSFPDSDVYLLEHARENNLKTYDVLPEIGIDDTLYSMFYFEEIYKKGKVTTEKLIKDLPSITKEKSTKLGKLNYFIKNKEDPKKIELIYTELTKMKIPYLEEYKIFTPVYPY